MERVHYGKVKLYRARCPKCGEINLSGEKKIVCSICAISYHESINKERVEAAFRKKRLVSQKKRKEIKENQNSRCYWCDREFGSLIWKKGKIIQLNFCVDHILPRSYIADDNLGNLVGSCHICNGFKHSKIFEEKDEIRGYILKRWAHALSDFTLID